jgi:large subunit ribosomal protein L4
VTTEGKITLEVVSPTRQRVGEIEVAAALVGGPSRPALLYEAVKKQLADRRAGTHATKTRGFVSGGGKKPWKQKGTGNARAGSSRSPIWRGGAIIFGPQPRSYEMAMPKSARRAALRAAIGARYGEGKLLVVDQIAVPDGKTRNLVGVLKGLGVEGSALIVVAGENPDVQRAGRNLPKVKVLLAGGLNVRDVLGHQTLLVTRDAIQAIAGRLVRKPVAGGAA